VVPPEGSAPVLSPETGDELAVIATEFGPQVMSEAAGGLWVSSVGSDSVQRIDPGTNQAEDPIDTEALPDGLLAHDGALWVATDLGPILQRVDPATGEITETWVVSDQGAINAKPTPRGDGRRVLVPAAGRRRGAEGRDPRVAGAAPRRVRCAPC
jgi:streptogramin lyase